MVGVPKSRGCKECRRQKKSCEGDSTPCTRCQRLKIPCIGRGEQRFKFQDENSRFEAVTFSTKKATSSNKRAPKSTSASPKPNPSEAQALSIVSLQVPANKHTHLVDAFLFNIDPSVDSRWQPPWSFAGLLEEIPKRLGHNSAFDAAAEAVLSAYHSYRARRLESPSHSGSELVHQRKLQHYSRALQALREALNDNSKAGTSETLCSTVMLLMYESLGSADDEKLLGHAGGAAHILKARGTLKARSDFEAKVLLSLRAPVIFRAMFQGEQLFSDEEWESFTHQVDAGAHADIMQHLSRVPNLLLAIRKALSGPTIDYDALYNTRSKVLEVRTTHEKTVTETMNRLDQMERDHPNSANWPQYIKMLHSAYGRHATTASLTDIHLVFLLSAIDFPTRPVSMVNPRPENQDRWMKIAAERALQISNLAERMTLHRPLGTFYMEYNLKIAYISAGDRATQLRILGQLYEYVYDMHGHGAEVDLKELEAMQDWLTASDLRTVQAQRAQNTLGSVQEMTDEQFMDFVGGEGLNTA